MNLFDRAWPLLAALLSGLCLAFCFPPFDWTSFVWLAVILLLAALWSRPGTAKKKRKGFALGFLAGFVFWSINLKWLAYVASGGYLLLAAYLAVYMGLFGMFASTAGNPWKQEGMTRITNPAARSLFFAALNAGVWCGLEWIRGWLFTGFGWNGLGVTFHDKLALAQTAEFIGVYGLSFLPVFVAAVLVQAGQRAWETAREGRIRRHWDFLTMIFLVFGTFLFGVLRVTMLNRADSEDITVLLVQTDVPQVAANPVKSTGEILADLQRETLAGLARVEARNEELIAGAEGEVELQGIDWVVWPEVVLYNLYSSRDDQIWPHQGTEDVVLAMREAGVNTLIAGANELEVGVQEGMPVALEDGRFFNSLAVFQGNRISTYRKQHLVIYGEFIPFSDSWSLPGEIYRLVAGVEWGGNMGRGEGNEGFAIETGGKEIPVIPSICFEDTVPRVTRKFSKAPGEVIVNVTNDGWFGTTEGSAQHFVNALFRSIELRRPMVRSANRGVTGVVSATGSLVDYRTGKVQALLDEKGRPFVKGALEGTVHIPKIGRTFYARFGDWFAICGLIAGLVWIALGKTRKNPRGQAGRVSRKNSAG